MVSTDTLVVGALSSGHEIGLGLVGAAFIVFALVSSFVLPRRNPNFPGRGLGWYVTLCALFFVAMMAAVLVFGRESKEATGNESPAHTETRSGSLPGQGPTTTSSGGGGGGGAAPATQGDPVAGKAVFASAGCASCHTLKAANATGTIGPNLDQLKPAEAVVKHQVTNGGGVMPAFKSTLSAKQIDDVAAFVFSSTHS
jgi:mono/diheme cytochrome c family protein